ncbi:MAG: DUF4115 domain-containing protein [Actinobacteria bacterium]|nr:DUF4115 domain-containing protein [Actinomycetota bacterium]
MTEEPGQLAGDSPGAVLATARRSAGLSVEDVAAVTRIRVTLVRAIEQDDYAPCGADVYARGHLRSLAHAVGADAEALVADFDLRYSAPPAPALSMTPIGGVSEPVRDIARRAARVAPRWPAAIMGVLGVVIVLLVVGWLTGGRPSDRTPQAPSPAPRASAPETAPSPTPAAPTGGAAVPTAPSRSNTTSAIPAGVALRVSVAAQSSWLRVLSSAGSEVYQGILTAGQTMTFQDPVMLRVKYGNAYVVTVQVNGRDLGRPACPSQVCVQEYGATGTQAG